MATSLVITQRSVSGVAIVELTGPPLYDDEGERLARVRDRLADRIVVSGQIVIDLARSPHGIAAVVGTLVAVHLHHAQAAGMLKLSNPSERVTRVLHITRLESIFVAIFAPPDDDAVLQLRPLPATFLA